MNAQRIFSLSLSLIAAAILSACASENDTTSSKEPGSSLTEFASIPARRAEGESKVLSDYGQYQNALDTAKRGDDMWVQQFLAQAGDSRRQIGRASCRERV